MLKSLEKLQEKFRKKRPCKPILRDFREFFPTKVFFISLRHLYGMICPSVRNTFFLEAWFIYRQLSLPLHLESFMSRIEHSFITTKKRRRNEFVQSVSGMFWSQNFLESFKGFFFIRIDVSNEIQRKFNEFVTGYLTV